MAIKVQYNKTAVQQYRKQLDIREKALPTLKNKETALRMEVARISEKLAVLRENMRQMRLQMETMDKFWVEFPDILAIEKTEIALRNIAGVLIPVLKDIRFSVSGFSLFHQRPWIPSGIEKLKDLIRLEAEIETFGKQFQALNLARKKTTQKVNLYEKVQIPEYQSAIRKVKRYLEDKENLEKAAQKIVKERNQARGAI